jgi:hypothetical protein
VLDYASQPIDIAGANNCLHMVGSPYEGDMPENQARDMSAAQRIGLIDEKTGVGWWGRGKPAPPRVATSSPFFALLPENTGLSAITVRCWCRGGR